MKLSFPPALVCTSTWDSWINIVTLSARVNQAHLYCEESSKKVYQNKQLKDEDEVRAKGGKDYSTSGDMCSWMAPVVCKVPPRIATVNSTTEFNY